jgi:hypothetical protein
MDPKKLKKKQFYLYKNLIKVSKVRFDASMKKTKVQNTRYVFYEDTHPDYYTVVYLYAEDIKDTIIPITKLWNLLYETGELSIQR